MSSADVERIRDEMERAEARKLQPHFIRAFFLEAFRLSAAAPSSASRAASRSRTSRPSCAAATARSAWARRSCAVRADHLREGAHRVEGKPLAEFVCPGHPLLDALLDLIIERYGTLLKQGAVLVDPTDDGEEPRLLVYLEHAVQDGRTVESGERRVVSRRFEFVEVDPDGDGERGWLGAVPRLSPDRARRARARRATSSTPSGSPTTPSASRPSTRSAPRRARTSTRSGAARSTASIAPPRPSRERLESEIQLLGSPREPAQGAGARRQEAPAELGPRASARRRAPGPAQAPPRRARQREAALTAAAGRRRRRAHHPRRPARAPAASARGDPRSTRARPSGSSARPSTRSWPPRRRLGRDPNEMPRNNKGYVGSHCRVPDAHSRLPSARSWPTGGSPKQPEKQEAGWSRYATIRHLGFRVVTADRSDAGPDPALKKLRCVWSRAPLTFEYLKRHGRERGFGLTLLAAAHGIGRGYIAPGLSTTTGGAIGRPF